MRPLILGCAALLLAACGDIARLPEAGRKLYATVGSHSNVAEPGLAEEEGRAAIWEIDLAAGTKRLFATGLRNPNGLGWEPSSGALWTVVNERDELGSDLVPDYPASVRDGGFYGWPWSYWAATSASRPARRWTCSRASSARTARPGVAPSGWRWMRRARCWWRTTWGTRCGGWRRRDDPGPPAAAQWNSRASGASPARRCTPSFSNRRRR
jgi:glucose/arabinose dehydrogenase